MNTRAKRVLTAAVGGLAVVLGWVLLTLPPRPRLVDRADPWAGGQGRRWPAPFTFTPHGPMGVRR